MRKFAGFMALAMLAASLPVMAEEMTEVTRIEGLELVAELDQMDWVYGGNTLIATTDTGYALMDIHGNLLTSAIYDSDMDSEYGYIMAKVLDNGVNRCGLFREDGSIAMSFQYGEIEMLSREWAIGYILTEAVSEDYDYSFWDVDGYWDIKAVDIYYLPEGKCITTLPRSAFDDATAVGHRINIKNRETGEISTYDSEFKQVGTGLYGLWDDTYADYDYVEFYENGQEGVKDSQGNIIIKPMFQYLNSRYGDYYEVYNGEKYGVVDIEGNIVVPAEYEDILISYDLPRNEEGEYSGYCAGGYFGVVTDGKVAYVKEGGEVTWPAKYAQSVMKHYGASSLLNDLEGNTHIIAADGADTVLDSYNSVYPMEYGAGFFYSVTDDDYNEGMVDWHGNIVVPCEYDYINLSLNGKYVIVQNDYYSPYQIYKLNYPGEETELTTEDSETESLKSEEQAEIPQEAADAIGQAQKLIKANADANQEAIKGLLEDAIASLMGTSEAAAKLIECAMLLLEQDPIRNAGTVIMLLNQVFTIM